MPHIYQDQGTCSAAVAAAADNTLADHSVEDNTQVVVPHTHSHTAEYSPQDTPQEEVPHTQLVHIHTQEEEEDTDSLPAYSLQAVHRPPLVVSTDTRS